MNPKFTEFSFAIRYVFFVLSVLGCALYLWRLGKVPVEEKIPEQKMVGALSVLLIMFNDPFYPITIMAPNPVSSYFSVFFVVNFMIFVLFFWIIFLDRIHLEDGEKQTKVFEWKRIMFAFVTYILSLVLYVEYALDHLDNLPIVPTHDLLTTRFIVLEIILLILVVCGFIYIAFRYIKICMSIEEKLWRNEMFMFFSLFFLFTTLVIFVINGFRIHSYHGNRILLLYTEMNMYTFYMQYMYSVTGEEVERIDRGQLQDNEGVK